MSSFAAPNFAGENLNEAKDESGVALMSRATIRQRVNVPLEEGTGTFVTFNHLDDKDEHIAIEFPSPTITKAPLVRVHSECLTGDVFLSGKCDCGEQLREAVSLMQKEGGILIYLRQEGRGIGLYNKLDAYALQQRGFDTYEANNLLGFRDDLRSYQTAAQMLLALGHTRIRLLSNNPDKGQQLTNLGVHVTELISTGVFVKETNKGYLKAKATKTGHRINLDEALK